VDYTGSAKRAGASVQPKREGLDPTVPPIILKDAGVIEDAESATAFGAYMVLPRSTSGAVTFEYELPHNLIQEQSYSLKLQAQPGSAANPVTVRVEIPEGYAVRGTSHPFTWRDDRTLEFREMLYQDMTIKMYF
jgi:hypothetical protein